MVRHPTEYNRGKQFCNRPSVHQTCHSRFSWSATWTLVWDDLWLSSRSAVRDGKATPSTTGEIFFSRSRNCCLVNVNGLEGLKRNVRGRPRVMGHARRVAASSSTRSSRRPMLLQSIRDSVSRLLKRERLMRSPACVAGSTGTKSAAQHTAFEQDTV